MLFNNGWYPAENKEIYDRDRIENSFTPRTYIGVITRGEDLETGNVFRKGNTIDEQRWSINSLNLKHIAENCDI